MRTKKKLPSDALAGEEGSSKNILQRYNVAKRNTQNILSVAPPWAGELVGEIDSCWNWWKLRHYPKVPGHPEVNQSLIGYSCKRYKLCQTCAIKRQTKVWHELSAKIDQLGLAPENMHLVTITLSSSHELAEMLAQLRAFYQSLRQERKDSARREMNPLKYPWACLDGWVGRIEITWTKKGWHPHFHFLVVPRPECKQLFAFTKGKHPHEYGNGSGWWGSDWEATLGRRLANFTGGASYIVQAKQIKSTDGAAAEVSKYLFKFGDMPPERVWEAHRLTARKRLSNCGGVFYGLDLEPDDLLDDDTEADRPFWDFIMRWDGRYYDGTLVGSYTPQNGEEAA